MKQFRPKNNYYEQKIESEKSCSSGQVSQSYQDTIQQQQVNKNSNSTKLVLQLLNIQNDYRGLIFIIIILVTLLISLLIFFLIRTVIIPSNNKIKLPEQTNPNTLSSLRKDRVEINNFLAKEIHENIVTARDRLLEINFLSKREIPLKQKQYKIVKEIIYNRPFCREIYNLYTNDLVKDLFKDFPKEDGNDYEINQFYIWIMEIEAESNNLNKLISYNDLNSDIVQERIVSSIKLIESYSEAANKYGDMLINKVLRVNYSDIDSHMSDDFIPKENIRKICYSNTTDSFRQILQKYQKHQ